MKLIKINNHYYDICIGQTKFRQRGGMIVTSYDYIDDSSHPFVVSYPHTAGGLNIYRVSASGKYGEEDVEFGGDIVEVIGATPLNYVDIRLFGTPEPKDTASFYLNSNDKLFSIIDYDMLDKESLSLVKEIISLRDKTLELK